MLWMLISLALDFSEKNHTDNLQSTHVRPTRLSNLVITIHGNRRTFSNIVENIYDVPVYLLGKDIGRFLMGDLQRLPSDITQEHFS